jgi:hypothetical protein
MSLILDGSVGVSDIDGSAATPAFRGADANTGIFFPAADTIAFSEGGVEAMRIDSSGNVGIGTTTMVGKLNVNATGANSRIAIGDTAASTYSTVLMYGGSGKFNFQLGVQNNINNAFEITPSTATGGTTFSTPALVVDASGQVAIGSTNADPLSLSRDRNLAVVASGTSGAVTIVGAGNARIDFGVGTTRTAGIYSDSANFTEIFTNTALPLVFSTNNTERMRIDSSGRVLVGTTASQPGYGNTNTGVQLATSVSNFSTNTTDWVQTVNQNGSDSGARYLIGFRVSNGQVGNIQSNGSNCTFNSTSDYRLKENVAPLTGALNRISQLKPVTYNWKLDGSAGEGFIAHELQAVVPECVTGEKDAVDEEGKPDYQGIDTSFLVATLTAAIQEQQALIENLTTRLNALERK